MDSAPDIPLLSDYVRNVRRMHDANVSWRGGSCLCDACHPGPILWRIGGLARFYDNHAEEE